jgi:hypothetical protein
VVQLLSPIQNLLDVFLHDALDICQVLVELGSVGAGGRVKVVLHLALDELVEFYELVRAGGGRNLFLPLVGTVILCEFVNESPAYFVQVEEGKALWVGALRKRQVDNIIRDEVVKLGV